MLKQFETEFNGRKLIVKTGEWVGQANGACTVQYGETVVLATAVMGKEDREGVDFLPLTVEYEERFYAAGKIKGSKFIKRETRPPDEAILAGRLIDRPIRPLFNQETRREIQVVNTVLSLDQENDPDIIALYATSCALAISDIPWEGPVVGVRVGRVDGQLIINPTYAQRLTSDLDLVVAGTGDRILMLEAGAKEIPEDQMYEAMDATRKEIKQLMEFFNKIRKEIGKTKAVIEKKTDESSPTDEELKKLAEDFVEERGDDYLFKTFLKVKEQRTGAAEALSHKIDEMLLEKGVGKDRRGKIYNYVHSLIYKAVGRKILEKGQRIDGRALDEIRPLATAVHVLPRPHGSAVFSRGETQVLATVTLGAPGMEQYLDTMEESGRKRFMHHYNFPPYCSGEVKPLRQTGRRETGHGALVERGIAAIIPDQDIFPYTIRVVSEVLSSNGSTSMASCCASMLSLMDAGVPVKNIVAGVAIGLASEEVDKEMKRYKVFTDLQDLEDGPGGMDFKVIGSNKGITAIQMDTKTYGLTFDIIRDALSAAKKGREDILGIITAELAAPRAELSTYAPRIISFKIDIEKIREVIGPGGKVINGIIAKTGATIDIAQDGTVAVTSTNGEGMEKAINMIKDIVREVEVGEEFEGTVTRILDFGAFVELIPGTEGMVHVSQMAAGRTEHPSDVMKIGDKVKVKVIEKDEKGRINLSMRALMKDESGNPLPELPARPARSSFGGGRPRFGSRGGDDRGGSRGGFRPHRKSFND